MEVSFSISQPTGKSKRFRLKEGEYVIVGRSNTLAQVTILDEVASSKHCKILLQRGQVHVEDLKSKNGVFLNKVKILKQRMFIDDKVLIGESILTINKDRLSPEDYENLIYTGTHVRSSGGFTMELVNKISDNFNLGQTSVSTNKVKKSKKQKAYSKGKLVKKKPISTQKLKLLELGASIIDVFISVLVFIIGVLIVYLNDPKMFLNIYSNNSLISFLTSKEIVNYTISSFIISVLIFSINKRLDNGSIGQKFFKIN